MATDSIIAHNLQVIREELKLYPSATLVAVSKTKPIADIQQAYDVGQRAFGENIVQEMLEKYEQMPKDIQWHLIGHLQTNKVKYIAPFVDLIHSVDSLKLLQEIDKQAQKCKRTIDCLLQVYIADEDTKFGFSHDELIEVLRSEAYAQLKNVNVIGLMGIATNTVNKEIIREEFYELKMLFEGLKASFFKDNSSFKELSMGMSSDYPLALEQGSTMVRLGSTIFGTRITPHWKQIVSQN